jgi:hypothetical protein
MHSPSVLTSKCSTSGKRVITALGRVIWFFAVFFASKTNPSYQGDLTLLTLSELSGKVQTAGLQSTRVLSFQASVWPSSAPVDGR